MSKKLVEIFQQTPLGRFIAQLSAEQQRELFLCYVRDFLLLTMRASTWEELMVGAGVWGGVTLVSHGRVRAILPLWSVLDPQPPPGTPKPRAFH